MVGVENKESLMREKKAASSQLAPSLGKWNGAWKQRRNKIKNRGKLNDRATDP